MTSDEFFEKLWETRLSLHWEVLPDTPSTWEGDIGVPGSIRGYSDYGHIFCPISAVTNAAYDFNKASEAAVRKLGLSKQFSDEIIAAADYDVGHLELEHPIKSLPSWFIDLREKLISATGATQHDNT